MANKNRENHEAKGFAGLNSLVTDISGDVQRSEDVLEHASRIDQRQASTSGTSRLAPSGAGSGQEKQSAAGVPRSEWALGIWILFGGMAIVSVFVFGQTSRSPSTPPNRDVISQTSEAAPASTATSPETEEDIPAALLEMIAAAKSGDEKRLGAAKQALERAPKPVRPGKEITKLARQKNAEGTKLLNKKDWIGAIKFYREGREADPGDVEIAENLGFALIKAGVYGEAAKALVAALTMAPTRANSWVSFGTALAAANKTEDATAAFSNALRYSKSPKKTSDLLQKLARDNTNKSVGVAANQAVAYRVAAMVAEPLRPVLSKLAASAAPLYLPTKMELLSYEGKVVRLYALDNDQFPLTANANGYEVWFGLAPDCKAQYCLVGILYSNLGELSVEADEWIDLQDGSRAALLKGSEKQPDSIVVQKGNFNYGFEFLSGDSKAANIELANSALSLGLLPQAGIKSVPTAGNPLPEVASSAHASSEPTVALDAHKKMTSNYVRNVMKGLGSPIDQRPAKTSQAGEPSYPDRIDSGNEEEKPQSLLPADSAQPAIPVVPKNLNEVVGQNLAAKKYASDLATFQKERTDIVNYGPGPSRADALMREGAEKIEAAKRAVDKAAASQDVSATYEGVKALIEPQRKSLDPALLAGEPRDKRAKEENTGYLPNAPLTHAQGRSSFTVNNSRNDFGTLVKLYQGGGREASRTFYVKAGDSFTAERLDAGSYVMRYKNLLSDEIFETNLFSLREIPTYNSVQFSRVTITLYQVAGGNLHMRRANPADF